MPHHILIADDDPSVLKLLQNYLGRSLGYKIETALDGASALEAAGKQHFDLCILDVGMPGLSGAETYMRLKNLDPQTEVIFFTGDQEFDHKVDFLRFSLPAERVLKKPLTDFSPLTRLIIGILGPPAR